MDGLECSEINRSELERTLRIDSEFYSKSAIKVSDMLQSRSRDLLTTFVNVSDGNHMGISDSFIDDGVPYYRGQDAGAFFIENSNPICIDEKTFELPVMKRSHLKKGDVILSIVGTIGSLSLVYSNKSATCSCKLAILRPKEGKNAELLATFLRGKYGQAQITRFTRGAVQKGLILEDMDQLVVPVFGDEIVGAIKNAVQKAYQLQEEATKNYKEAQTALMRELGLIFPQVNSTISVEMYSNSIAKTDRLDAEYYQPQYKQVENAIFEYDSRSKRLSEIATYLFTGEYSKEYNNENDDVGLCQYIRGTDICNGQIERDSEHYVYPHKFSKKVSQGDILTGRVGTIGNFGVVNSSLAGAVCSDNILCFHLPSKYSPNVYALYFNSDVIKSLVTRLSRGSVQQRLNQETIKDVLVPFISEKVQAKVDAQIMHSFALRMQSKQLLEYAKQAVEMAIEQGEDVALEWLKDKVG